MMCREYPINDGGAPGRFLGPVRVFASQAPRPGNLAAEGRGLSGDYLIGGRGA
jgi:hypothetical protein